MRIDTAIEVINDYEECGDGTPKQVPGLRHWVANAGAWEFGNAIAACGIKIAGMVPDKNRPDRLTCPECITEFVASKLKEGSCWGCDGQGWTRALARDNNVEEIECTICDGTGTAKWAGIGG